MQQKLEGSEKFRLAIIVPTERVAGINQTFPLRETRKSDKIP